MSDRFGKRPVPLFGLFGQFDAAPVLHRDGKRPGGPRLGQPGECSRITAEADERKPPGMNLGLKGMGIVKKALVAVADKALSRFQAEAPQRGKDIARQNRVQIGAGDADAAEGLDRVRQTKQAQSFPDKDGQRLVRLHFPAVHLRTHVTAGGCIGVWNADSIFLLLEKPRFKSKMPLVFPFHFHQQHGK